MTTCKHQIRDQYQTRNCLRKPTRDGYCYSHHPDSQKKAIDRVITNSKERKSLRRIQEAGPELLAEIKAFLVDVPDGCCAWAKCNGRADKPCPARQRIDFLIARLESRNV